MIQHEYDCYKDHRTCPEITPCRSSYPGDAAQSDGQQTDCSMVKEYIPISSYNPCMSGSSPCTTQSAQVVARLMSDKDVPPACCNVSSPDSHMMPAQQPDMDPRTIGQSTSSVRQIISYFTYGSSSLQVS